MNLSVMLSPNRTTTLCTLRPRLARGLLRPGQGHLSPRLQWQLGPSIVLQLLTSDIALQRRRIRRRRVSARVTLLLFLGSTRVPAMPRLHMQTVRAGTVIKLGTGKATVLSRQRRATKRMSARGVFTIQLWKKSLLVR